MVLAGEGAGLPVLRPRQHGARGPALHSRIEPGHLLAEAGTGTGKPLAEVTSVPHRAERFFKLLIGSPGRRLTPRRMSPREAEESRALVSRLEGLKAAILVLGQRRRPEAVGEVSSRTCRAP